LAAQPVAEMPDAEVAADAVAVAAAAEVGAEGEGRRGRVPTRSND
jgi:hypothetical protein